MIAAAFSVAHSVMTQTSLLLLLFWVPLFYPVLAELGVALPLPTLLVLDAAWVLRRDPWIWFPLLSLASAADLVGLVLLEWFAPRIWLWVAGLGIGAALLLWNVTIPSSFYLMHLSFSSAVPQELREASGIPGGAGHP